jgi:hypothetical protein
MANLANNPVDTRTFAQFCAGLTKRDWIDIQAEIALKLRRSAQTIYYWRSGSRIPCSIPERKIVSDLINRKFNINTRYWTLFPEA